MQGTTSYRCAAYERCDITPYSRNSCQFCRLQKCYAVGMSRQGERASVYDVPPPPRTLAALSSAAIRPSVCPSHATSSTRRILGLSPVSNTRLGWRCGVVVSGVRRMNEVNARRARLVLGRVTVFGRVNHLGMNKPTMSTQPCIPPGLLNRVPASSGVKAGMSPLSGGR